MCIRDRLKSAPISYVKWDMNRNMTEIGSTAWPAKKQKEIAQDVYKRQLLYSSQSKKWQGFQLN